jgi:peptide/nickel transport system substrate-binding protein
MNPEFPGDGAGALERRRTRRELVKASAAAGFALSISGLGAARAAAAPYAATATPKTGGKITFAMSDGGPGDTLNPFTSSSNNEFATALFLYDSLFQRDGHNVPIPSLALDVAPVRNNARIWRLKLRRGVTFHDGRPLTADDVLWSFRYAFDPKNKAVQRASLNAIEPSGVTKSSAYEVLFRLKRPIGDFKGYLAAAPSLYIIPNGTTSLGTTAIGTGPFKLKSFAPGQQTELLRNTSYWDHVYLDQVTIVPIPDSNQRMSALVAGQVDAVFLVDFVQAKLHQRDSAVKLIAQQNASIVPIYVQMDAPEFRDKRVRLALKLSVDRPKLVQSAQNGFGTIGNDVYGAGYPSYNTHLAQHHYDPAKAKSLLKAAGKSGLKVTLFTSTAAPGMQESATVWKQQASPAGIDVNLVRVPAGSYFTNDKYLKVPSYQSQWLGYSFENWAPQALFKDSPFNETHWADPKWEAAFKRAQSIVDDTRRNAAYQALQVPIWAEGGYIIWGYQPTIHAVSARVQGARPWSNLNIHPQDWWVA